MMKTTVFRTNCKTIALPLSYFTRQAYRLMGTAAQTLSAKANYTTLPTSGKLNSYPAYIDKQAENTFSQLVTQLADYEGLTEKLKQIISLNR
jgi:hypothetical protein